jgi:hypothetical protein
MKMPSFNFLEDIHSEYRGFGVQYFQDFYKPKRWQYEQRNEGGLNELRYQQP